MGEGFEDLGTQICSSLVLRPQQFRVMTSLGGRDLAVKLLLDQFTQGKDPFLIQAGHHSQFMKETNKTLGWLISGSAGDTTSGSAQGRVKPSDTQIIGDSAVGDGLLS